MNGFDSGTGGANKKDSSRADWYRSEGTERPLEASSGGKRLRGTSLKRRVDFRQLPIVGGGCRSSAVPNGREGKREN